jgi:hypothetical protein
MDIKHLKHNFSQPVLQLARKLEKKATQSASWKNHITFNHQCKRLGLTPPSLRLHTNVQGQAAQHIIATAQRKLTTVRISQCHECLRRLNVAHQHLTASLASSMPPQDFTNLTSQIQRLTNIAFQRTKDRQKSKLANLLTPRPRAPSHRRLSIEARSQCDAPLLISTHRTPPTPTTTNPTDHWLFNKSSISLTEPQVKILTKGLAFRPTPRHP